MKKGRLLRIVNILLAADFLIIAVTAILHELIIPTGFYASVHAVPGFVFLILVLTHLYLNRKWIRANYFKNKQETD